MGLLSIIRKVTDVSNGGQNLPWISRKVMAFLYGYDHKKYWRRRAVVVDASNKTNPLLKIYYLLWIKRVDSKHHCSFGASYNFGYQYVTPPMLPHGPNGIIVGLDAKIGASCVIYHQVTIAGGNVTIGDHTELGAGAKVLPNVTIGSHCHVGANAVVVEDMPDYSTCVMQKPRIILQKKEDNDNKPIR